MIQVPGPNFIELLCLLFKNVCITLDCFYLGGFSSPVYCLQVSSEPTQVKHFLGAPLKGRLLALNTNIILGWTGLPWTNTLAYS